MDTFSLLADKKETAKQTELFTENATVETYVTSKLVSSLHGKNEIGVAFERFLKNFDVVYHFNGQHVVSIKDAHATGDLYCLTYLFGTEAGAKMKTTIGVHYQDEYVFQGGKWLIAKRTSFFEWQSKEPVSQ